MLDRIPEDMLNKMSEDIPNHIIKDILARMPENMSDTRKYRFYGGDNSK